ncbi:acetoacetate--CoA ligase [Dasania sp. GY-MA-18]|uniref:Acetoacetate--CoA ligase n=1 Tax=Dasania phycosphaerae TaxID=2950436 RepID=A0A9J6RPD1_9GAMM|nr:MULTISPECIES: acetoacetate--CoA ligase [Dasania]MCR8923938.1 acetoacetate--CoA ligase [Dasania sp. GY-MA-18]MCZ0866372.1 acetoacetate--CoA ligase [Dasania phycosphaerae]MCZ0870096.1 acetoacetate--CoA ligase [Dasania phycosphaerae]
MSPTSSHNHQPLWQASEQQILAANLSAFRHYVNKQIPTPLQDYPQLYQWSLQQPQAFWGALWDYAQVRGQRGNSVLHNGEDMLKAQWFPQAQLNFAENLLRRQDDSDAIVFWGEDQVQRRLSHGQLYQQVSRTAQALAAAGVVAGDRVAATMPNMPETLIAMLAATSLGAIWSSCSPDFGVASTLDRFQQIQPRILFSADGYFYNGQWQDSLLQTQNIAAQLASVEQVIVAPYAGTTPAQNLKQATWLADFIAPYSAQSIPFVQLPFNHPLYILYSSGTTGIPKCIVHSAGGTLLQHLKEHLLHVDIKPGDKLFYYSTCGWMMWNWLASGLAAGATLMLYDGSPFYPSPQHLFDYAQQEAINIFGTSAKFIDSCRQQQLQPKHSHDLSALRCILSTGSPLLAENFDYVYKHIKTDLCLSSISGGTDIISCFALGNPVLPVWRGELQCRGLGMAVNIFDEQGQAISQQKGELVCTQAFPSMPIGFWNDPEQKKYRAAYFSRYPKVWCQSDYAELTEHEGLIIYGRSDATLNPGGVRIGTAEIYRQLTKVDEVLESLVIGQEWQGDVRIVLFVMLRTGLTLNKALSDKIKTTIRANTSPRHVPAKIIQVNDVPRTRSGKILELAVRNLVHGQTISNIADIVNPESLQCYSDLAELKH